MKSLIASSILLAAVACAAPLRQLSSHHHLEEKFPQHEPKIPSSTPRAIHNGGGRGRLGDPTCQFTAPNGQEVDLSSIPTWVRNTTMIIDGKSSQLEHFVVSLCSKTSQTFSPEAQCDESYYVAYQNIPQDNCNWYFPGPVVQDWHYNEDIGAVQMVIESMGSQYTMEVNLYCKEGIGSGLVEKSMVFNASWSSHHFRFEYYAEAACATAPATPTPTPSNGECSVVATGGKVLNLSYIPVYSGMDSLSGSGSSSDYSFVVDLCQPISQPPADTSACSGAGYISYYTNSTPGFCQTYFPKVTKPWYWNSVHSYAETVLESVEGWTAYVHVSCPSSDNQVPLRKQSFYETALSGGKYDFHFEFYSQAVCV